jgi:hypothetical protein
MSPFWIDFDTISLVQILPVIAIGWMLLTMPVSGVGSR